MMIRSQDFGDAAFMHYDKRGAVGEGPFLVWACVEEREALVKQFRGSRNDLDVLGGTQVFDRRSEDISAIAATEEVADFNEDELGGDAAALVRRGNRLGLGVQGVVGLKMAT